MDTYTLSMYTIALALTIGCGLHLCYAYLIEAQVAGVSFVANAFLLIGLSLVPLALGHNQDNIASVLFSNITYSLAFCTLLVGVVRFRGASRFLGQLSLVIILFTLVVFIYSSIIAPSISVRIETRCALVILVSSIAIYANVFGTREDDRIAKLLLTVVLALNIAYMVVRGWFAVTDLPITDYFLAPNVHKLSFLVVSITMLMTTFSIVWMLMARVIAQSYTSSITDELTGLYNRKGLRELYPNLSQHKTSYPIGIILADLDHFKLVNDTFGHEMGDNTLKHFSMLLMRQSRHEDLCVRYGGEEFLLVIPGVNLQTTVEVANRIRRCAQHDSNQDLYTCSYTASLGVSVLANGESLSDAIKRADDALYRAKGIGRNRVACDSRSTFAEAILR